MTFRSIKWWTLLMTLALMIVSLRIVSAQDAPISLTGDQQSAAKSALCSAIASRFPNPATAGPSAVTDPGVLSTAAASFAGSTKLPLPSATDIIKSYAMQHATEVLGSCAGGSVTGGMVPQIPVAGSMPSMPSMPKLP